MNQLIEPHGGQLCELMVPDAKKKQFQKEALALLEKFPPSPYKESLELMVNYVIERKK